MQSAHQRALAGTIVIEIGGGAASAYCGCLLADAGAAVTVVAAKGDVDAALVRADTPAERAFAAYLAAGKARPAAPLELASVQQLCRTADIVLVGEESKLKITGIRAKRAVVDFTWFGTRGTYKDWRGNDLIIQALTAMPHLAGPVDGPPLYAGDRHSAMVGGITGYIAALAGLLARPTSSARHFSLSILEANMVLSEMDIHFVERNGASLERRGINRFSPNGPVGVYPCKEGWVGITATTPDQWKSLCMLLQMHKEASDERLATRELRFARLDEVEDAMVRTLAGGTALEWAELGRQHRVPIVFVPDAAGILGHPIFRERRSRASLVTDGRTFKVPRTPLGLSKTPTVTNLSADQSASHTEPPAASTSTHAPAEDDAAPLSGVIIADFTMGWAGPLASRVLADLGAEIIKIEAGRYPDWWRGVNNPTPDYIETRQYENAKGYCALNCGKRGISVDLTRASGREIGLALVARADAIIENQAAGVMDKLGLGYDVLSAVKPDIVMVSMSAFGTGNAWSDTRAYGSTLEHGAGLPSFMGVEGTPPTMWHLAYGDPVSGLYGCAALLTALVHKRRAGEGQNVNVSMVESMLQFTTPALLHFQTEPGTSLRRGNRHPVLAPHGIYRCGGEDRWIAIAVNDAEALVSLGRIVGREDWADRPEFATAEARKRREDEIDDAITAWSMTQEPHAAAATLQAAGVAAAPVLHTEEIVGNPHFIEANFFIDLVREVSGPQRQIGVAIQQNGKRLGARSPAPLLGEHSWEIAQRYVALTRANYERLVLDGVISFEPSLVRRARLQKGNQSDAPTAVERTTVGSPAGP